MSAPLSDRAILAGLLATFCALVAAAVWVGTRTTARAVAACEARGGVYTRTPHGHRCVRPVLERPTHAID